MSFGRKRVQSSSGLRITAQALARVANGGAIPTAGAAAAGGVGRTVPVRESNARYRAAHDRLALKVFAYVAVLLVLAFLSLGVMGAQGQYYGYSHAYATYTPAEVAWVLYCHAYNALAQLGHGWAAHSNEWLQQNAPGYWAVPQRAGVIGVTLVCAVLLSVSGMLYQNAFKNPIAGPGMLGVGSGVSLGMMLVVALYGAAAPSMLQERYAFCYGFGAAILVFVILVGRRLSGPGRSFDVVTMLLVGSILSQLLGFVVSYMTLFVMDEESYAVFYTMSQMLVVDTSVLSWTVLGIAAVASLVPVVLNRYRLTALAFDDNETRMLGFSASRLRALALVCGAIMILAAQVHVGMVSLVSLIVPFLARTYFGCEFRQQLIGNVCIGCVLLLACRTLCDLVPFVGDGLALGSVVSVVALPLFVAIMARQMRGWD